MPRSNGLFASLVLATILAVGFATVWGVMVVWGYETVRSFQPPRVEERPLLLADGRAVVERVCQANGVSVLPPEEQFRDLQGNFVQVPEEARWVTGVSLYRRETGANLLGGMLAPEESWNWRLKRFGEPHAAVAWYFLCDGRRHGTAYFVAYDTRTASRVGYLGREGFRTAPLPPAECFPFDGSERGILRHLLNHGSYGQFLPVSKSISHQPRIVGPEPVYLQAENDTIYQIDLTTKQVHTVFSGQPIMMANLLTRYVPGPRTGPTSLIVRTGDAVLAFDRENKLIRRFPVPDELRDQSFAWLELPTGDVVTLTNLDFDFELGRGRFRYSWFDAAGEFLRREETELTLHPQTTERALATGMLTPVVSAWLCADPLSLSYYTRWSDYGTVLRNRLLFLWPGLLLAQVVAVVLAVAAVRRLARYAAPPMECLAWALFILLTGLPGWIGFRVVRPWPVHEICPACGVSVPRERVPCSRCATDFPQPAKTGTEVFA